MTFRLLFWAVLAVVLYFIWKLAEVKLKAGASLKNVSWRMFWVAIIADGVFKSLGTEAVITSGADGTHSARSKHYPENNPSGLVEALDFRTWHVKPEEAAKKMRSKLGPDYDIVVESTHIHAEYHPKTS